MDPDEEKGAIQSKLSNNDRLKRCLLFRRESPVMDVEASEDLGRDNFGLLAEPQNLDKG
jgi:hypothetical protein